jgi:hypothetical protein
MLHILLLGYLPNFFAPQGVTFAPPLWQIPTLSWERGWGFALIGALLLQKPHQSFHLIDGSNDLSVLDDTIAIAI